MVEDNLDFNTRLVKNEMDIANLSKSVGQIASSVNDLSDSVHDGFRDIHNTVSDEVSKVYDKVYQSQRTSWPTLLAGFAIFVTIANFLVTQYSQQQKVQDDILSKLQDTLIEQAYKNGRMDELTITISSRLDRIDQRANK